MNAKMHLIRLIRATCLKHKVRAGDRPSNAVLTRMSGSGDPSRFDYVPFLRGACGVFAHQLHLLSGWPIVGFTIGKTIHHFAVQHPTGRFVDAKGMFTAEEIIRTIPGVDRERVVVAIYSLPEFLAVWWKSNHRYRGPNNRSHLAGKAIAMICAWRGRYGFHWGSKYERIIERRLASAS